MKSRKEYIFTSFLAIICVIALLLMPFREVVLAVTEDQVTATTGETIKQGDTGYCYVYIDSTEGLASLDVSVHYDSSKITITNIYNSVSCVMYDKSQTESSLRFTYLFDGEGKETKTRLFYFTYKVHSDAVTGDSYWDIVVNEAYDASLSVLPVSGSRCNFSITESIQNKTCAVYSSGNISTSVGREFTISYRFSTYQIASGVVQINYDPELFEVVTVTNGGLLTNKVVDINTSFSGTIYASFVGTAYYADTNYMTVTFRTLKNITESSMITFTPVELYDLDLNLITCKGCETTANIALDETYIEDDNSNDNIENAPVMRLDGTFSYEDKQIILEVSLEENSHLGAGDFVINFDPELVTYNSCSKAFAPSFFNINDKNVDSGELSFHIISLSDIVTEEKVLTIVFDVNHPYVGQTADFILEGMGITDSMAESILLNLKGDSIWLEYQVVFQDADGTLLQSDMYHYGDIVNVPSDPIRPSDDEYMYTFTGWDKGITTCEGDAVYTATYSKTPIVLMSIEVTTRPYKLIYSEGDSLDLSGMVVTAHYDNGTSKAVTEYTISGDISTLGNKTITVSYGGKTAIFTVTVNSKVPSSITSSKYIIQNGNISKITEGTTVASLLSGINEGLYCKVYKGNSAVSGDTLVGTGMVVKLMDGDTVKDACTIVVTGDTNGDGSISITDMIAIKAHVLKKTLLTGTFAIAADTNGDGVISVTDFIQVKAKILGKGTITAR